MRELDLANWLWIPSPLWYRNTVICVFCHRKCQKLEVKLCHQAGFIFVVLHHNSAVLCGGIKSPYCPRKPLRGCCTLASAETQGFISLLPLSHPLGQGSARAITSPPDAVFYICDVSGDTWPCTVLDGNHGPINSQGSQLAHRCLPAAHPLPASPWALKVLLTPQGLTGPTDEQIHVCNPAPTVAVVRG